MKEKVNTPNAPQPIGPYSQAVKASGEFLFVSGQIPLTSGGELAGDDILSQAHQSIKNVLAIVGAAGGNADSVVKTTVLLKNIGDFKTVNEIYNQYFGESKPARAAYQVAELPLGVLIEIEAVAVL